MVKKIMTKSYGYGRAKDPTGKAPRGGKAPDTTHDAAEDASDGDDDDGSDDEPEEEEDTSSGPKAPRPPREPKSKPRTTNSKGKAAEMQLKRIPPWIEMNKNSVAMNAVNDLPIRLLMKHIEDQ